MVTGMVCSLRVSLLEMGPVLPSGAGVLQQALGRLGQEVEFLV